MTMCDKCDRSGVFVADTSTALGLPGWVQRCDACEVYEHDLEALNAVLEREGRKPMRGYPFSLVHADWGRPVEQRFWLNLRVPISLCVDEPNTIPDVDSLADSLAENLLDWIMVATDDGRDHAELVGSIWLEDCESIVAEG